MPTRLNRSVISVSGADARVFLNGLLTQDVALVPEQGWEYAALLSPQGKVLADMIVWGSADGFWLDVDPTRAADLLRRLTMYKLRAEVALADLSDTHGVLWDEAQFDGARPDPRLEALGWRRITTEHRDVESGDAAFDARRLTLGVPDLARDAAPEEVFALEALLEEFEGVDFQKGCFVGQENVSRMKRRATTRKKFCPVVFDGPAPAYGTPIRAGDAELGSVRTGMTGRAIALLRLDRAFEALDAGRALAAGELPLRLDPPAWLLLPSREAPGD